MPSYFVYCRKSTEEEERQILSIESQLTELREFARQNSLQIAKEFTESKSAKEPGRPVFNQMLAELEEGNAEGILAWNPDRLARNSVDGGRIIYLVDTGKIKSLKFPTFWFEPTPQGKFMLSVAFSQAKFFTDNLRENILRGLRQKLRKGQLPSKAPLGYLNEPRLRTIEPDPKVFRKVRSVFQATATGQFTLTQIQRKMFSLGLVGGRGRKPIPLSSIQTVLTNPFYYGLFRYRGEIHEGSHKPMISKKLFDRVQQALKENGKPRKKRQDSGFPFLNFLRCAECSYCITAERHTKKSGLVFVYYRCTKKSKIHKCTQSHFLREESLAEQIRAITQKVSLPDEWRGEFLSKIDEWQTDEHHSSGLFAQNVKGELEKIKARLQRLMDIYLDGSLDLSEFQETKNALIEKRAGLIQRLSDFERKGNHWVEPLRQWIISANHAKNIAEGNNYPEMKEFLKSAGSNRLLSAGQVQIEFKKPWDLLREMPVEAHAGKNPGSETATNELWWS